MNQVLPFRLVRTKNKQQMDNHFVNCEVVPTCRLLLSLSLRGAEGREKQATEERKPGVQLGLLWDGLPSKQC